jgi:hypothetical protein
MYYLNNDVLRCIITNVEDVMLDVIEGTMKLKGCPRGSKKKIVKLY